ncbi:MAG: alpha/beta hydrolase [Nitrososphaerales archaeon]
MQVSLVTRMLSRRSLALQAAGAVLAESGAAYYFTHPFRVAAELPETIRSSAQSVTVTAADGASLHAIWIPGRGSNGQPFDRTIVHHHGYNSCGGVLLARRAVLPRMAVPLPWGEQRESLCAWPLISAGLERAYNFLLLDARAHGKSGGSWDPTGSQQVSDAALWARWLREQHHQLWAGFWGNSFGGAIGLGLALRPSGGGYDAMVLDSAVVMAEGVYSGAVRPPLYAAIRPVIEQLGSRDLYLALQDHQPWMPILLIHGTEDGHVPAWQSERIYELLHNPEQPARTALWLVPGASHLQSLEVAEEEYVRRTLDWFDKWL